MLEVIVKVIIYIHQSKHIHPSIHWNMLDVLSLSSSYSGTAKDTFFSLIFLKQNMLITF